MIPDSMNPRQMSENILELQRQIKEAGSELPTPGVGDTGKILKVGSEGYELATEYSYTPPAYSATEHLTGRKWIDGSDVYEITFTGTTPAETGTYTFGNIPNLNVLVHLFGGIVSASGYYHAIERAVDVTINKTTGDVTASIAGYLNMNYGLTVQYIKTAPTPDVVPAPDNDTRSVSEPIEEVTEEPVQETKTTRKRSTSSK